MKHIANNFKIILKNIFAQAWKEAMQKHQGYKKEKLKRIEAVKKELKDEMDKKTTSFLGGIGLYYLKRSKEICEKFLKSKK